VRRWRQNIIPSAAKVMAAEGATRIPPIYIYIHIYKRWLKDAAKCQTQMSPISQWQSMKIYRKLRTNKILRLFAFFIYDAGKHFACLPSQHFLTCFSFGLRESGNVESAFP